MTFTTNKLPNGTAYLTIEKELFKDSWGNKNAEVKDLALTVTVDKVKPTVKSIKASDDKTIVIEFSEDITLMLVRSKYLMQPVSDVTKDNALPRLMLRMTKVTMLRAKFNCPLLTLSPVLPIV